MIGLVLTAALIAAVFIYRTPPEQSRFYPPCIFKKGTGYDCAGCGSARATHQLLHGNIPAAADHNLLLLLLLPLLFIGLVYYFTGHLKKQWLLLNRPLLLLLLILFFWFVRNIPREPFNWLHSGLSGMVHSHSIKQRVQLSLPDGIEQSQGIS